MKPPRTRAAALLRITLLCLLGVAGLPSRPAVAEPLPVKRILIYGDQTDMRMPRLRWFLYDPLILAKAKLAVDARPLPVIRQPGASWVTTDQPNIVLSALYVENGALRIRFYETAGKATAATVSLPFCKADRGTQIRFDGEQIRSLRLEQGIMKLEFKPWEIVNVSVPLPGPQ
jgi:hypothetical protein